MPRDASAEGSPPAIRDVPDQVSGPGEELAAPFVPLVPAGGSGTRLWPLSRVQRPKFLLDPLGVGRSLLQQTLDRVGPLGDLPPLVVTGEGHGAAVRTQVGPAVGVLTEPSPRDSMAAIALAAAVVERAHSDAVIGSFPADHLIGDEAALGRAVRAARRAAERGYLVTIGIEPTRPATGFGYIERGDERSPTMRDLPGLEGTGAEPVASFVEKPDAARAAGFLAGGRHLWNAGMFVVRARVLLDALAEQIPPLAAGVRRIAAALGPSAGAERIAAADEAGPRVLAEVWPTLTRIAIDHALAEPLAAQGRVAVVPADLDWDDVGDFASLARQVRQVRGGSGRTAAEDVVSVGGARTIGRDARATVYGSSHRPIALVGVDGLSVVETDDVLLVLADDRAQSLAQLVAELEADGLGGLR